VPAFSTIAQAGVVGETVVLFLRGQVPRWPEPVGKSVAARARQRSGTLVGAGRCAVYGVDEATRRLLDPELFEQDAPLRVVEVVADPFGDDVDVGRNVRRHDG
jgi:hypothetical protein